MGIFIYGDNKNIKGLEYNKKLFNKVKFKREYKSNEEIEEIYLKNKKIILNIEGQELFIKIIKIPKVKRKYLRDVVQNEVLIRYGEDIIYNYDVLEEKTNCFKIVLYCAHEISIRCLQNNNVKNGNLIKIDFAQNNIINYYSKMILKETYILIVQYRDYIYFLKVYKNKLIFNKIIQTEKYNENDIKMEIDNFLDCNTKYKNIYYSNLENFKGKLNELNATQLLNIDMNTFLKYII